MHFSRRRLLRRGLEFHMCTINKSAHTKKSGNLSYAPRTIRKTTAQTITENLLSLNFVQLIVLSTNIHLLKPVHWPSGSSVHQWSGRPRFNTRSRHTKNSKILLVTSLLNSQQYKVRIKGKVEQSRERRSVHPYTSV